MTTSTVTAPVTRWDEPAGINPRGTLAVLPGSGESADVYRRFAGRISSDAYRVAVVQTDGDADPVAQVRELASDPWAVSPLVVVGSDSGALQALSVAASLPDTVAAVVVAGLPVGPGAAEKSWEEEIELRTACPNHQGVLRSAAQAHASAGVDTAPTTPATTVPVLAVHGASDELSPLDDALAIYRNIPNVAVKAVADGRHDILNDVTHRSVAATVVLFLERLRLDSTLPEIVSDVDPTGVR